MLQDAIWANSEKLADAAYADQTTKFIKASIKGWVYARDNPEEAATIVTAAGSPLGESHQLWMTNEINKLIWPSTSGHRHDRRRRVEADRRHRARAPRTRPARRSSPKQPPETAKDNDYVDKALAELKAEGVDVDGKAFAPITVELKEGGE